MQDSKSFLAALFDFSFSEFITVKLIKILYVIGIIIAGIAALIMIGGGFRASFFAGLLALIISPIVFLLYILVIRIWLELIIVLFKIADNTKNIAEK
jgi:hypothetical protein